MDIVTASKFNVSVRWLSSTSRQTSVDEQLQ